MYIVYSATVEKKVLESPNSISKPMVDGSLIMDTYIALRLLAWVKAKDGAYMASSKLEMVWFNPTQPSTFMDPSTTHNIAFAC